MILFPAIDLKDGKCVRLIKGNMKHATTFNDKPEEQAKKFADMGFQWIHLVDLNGAFEGYSVNAEIIKKIRKAVSIPIQLGGGIRNMEHIKKWTEYGINRIILGTAAVSNPDLVKQASQTYPNTIALALDAQGDTIAINGWAKKTSLKIQSCIKIFEHDPIAAIIYTDISRDGIKTGLNIQATRNIAHTTHIPVIASGGIASINDIENLLKKENHAIKGAICGRALYDGSLNPIQALKKIQQKQKNTS